MAEKEPPKIEFDVPSALSSGYTASDIAKYLTEQSGLDYDEAIRGGYDDDSLIMNLATKDGEAYTDPSAFKVFTESAAKGLMQSIPAFEGGKMGFQIGMKLPGPLKLLTPITTAGGALSGYVFGDNLSELFNFEDNVVPSKMPYKVMGETAGGGMGFFQAPFRAAATVQPGTFAWMKQNAKDLGSKLDSTFLEKLGYSAQRFPGLTLAMEGTSVAGASVAGALSEAAKPGDNFNRLLSELFGGTAGPTILMGFAPAIFTGAKNLSKYFTAEGRMDLAGTQLKKILDDAGVDINKLLQTIDDADDMGIENMSTAAVTGEQALTSLNKKLFSNYKYFEPELVGQLRKNLSGAEKLITKMVGTNDPNLIADAAKIRDELFKAKITLRLADARIKAENIIGKMAPGPDTATKASNTIQDLVFKALDDVRAEEKRLYQLIPGGTEITAPATRKTLQQIIGKEILEGELKELGIKPSGLQVINKILGVTTEAPGFTKNFLNASDKNQRGFFSVVGYSPTPLVGVKEPSGKWQIDKSIIEGEYDLKRGALNNLTIDDLRKNNLSALDNVFFQETGEAIPESIRKDLLNDLSSKHLKSLREASSSLTFRGSADNKSLGKLIDEYIKEFTSKQPEQETTSLLDEKFLSLKEILNLRSQLFSTARAKSASGDTRDAGIINKIANAITDDIGTKADAGDGTSVTNLLKQAHSFSKSLNDTFTRGFPNTILKRQKSGKLNVIPELAINSIFQGGGDAVAYNYSGIESAITFLQKQSGKELDEALTNKLGTLKASQEDLLYVMFSEVVNQETKRVDGDKLARFMSYAKGGYGKVLDRFPDLKNDLKDLQTAQNLYDARKQYYGEVVQGILKPGNLQAKRRLKNVFSFADLLPADTNPGFVISNAIGEPNRRPGNPVNNLKRIIAFGKKAENPDVLEGIKETIFDRAFQFARNEKDVIDFKAFKDYLIKPMVKGQPSVLEILRNTGVLSSDEALRFSQITNRMITAQKSIPDDATKPIEGPLVSGVNTFVDLFARLVGSKVGSMLASVIPGRGQGIIESAAGVRTVIGGLNIPTSMTQDLLLQAARDPKFFKLLVTRPKTEKEAVVTAKRVRAYLLNAGLGFVSRELDDDTEEFKKGAPPLPRQFDPDFIPDKQSSVNLPKEGFPTTQTATVPQSGVNARLAANVGAAPQAAPNLNQRQQFASLFPNDPISGLINAQQPPRLMAEGGDVPDLREAPEVDDLRALTLEEFKEATLKHLLELQDQKDRAYEKYVEPTKYSIIGPLYGGRGPQNNPIFLKEAQQLEQEMRNFGIDRQKAIANYEDALREGKMVSMRSAKDIEQGNVIIRGFPDYLVNPVKNMRQGGAAYDMGLEGDLAAQETIQSALEGGSDNNETPPSFNFRNVPTTVSRGILSLMDKINMAPDITGLQGFVRNTPVGVTAPVGLQTNIGGFPVSFTPTFNKGGIGFLAETTFKDGGAVEDEYGQDDDMDYTDVDYGYMSDEDGSTDDFDIATNIGKATGGTLVGEIPYDLFNLRDQMNKKALETYKQGQIPDYLYDDKGNITAVGGLAPPGSSFRGIPTNPVSAIAMLGNMMGARTYTGYDPSLYAGGDPNSENGGIANLPSAPVDTAEIRRRAIDLYNMDPNRYRLFGS
tara:strand:+ start:2172 stop:7076 length:4905 start_codon:yes stop_codon:yes gene_type:complete